jgi:hypothetical protein
MGYYMAGDYYAAGGIFSTIAKGIGGAVKGFVSGGPLGAIGGAISGVTGKGSATQTLALPPAFQIPSRVPTIVPSGGTIQPTSGLKGVVQRLVPGGASGYEVVGRKRRRMNVTNDKALRRAIRRQQGFVKLAKRALRGTGYTVATRGRSKRPVSIRESGPGSVVVR